MADVFLSHSSKDHVIAEQICEGLEANGISCWIAPRDITAGTEWALAINNAISTSKVFLIVYSEKSAQSKQVSKELGLAGARGIPMIPYKIDDTPLSGEFEYYLLSSHWIAADEKNGDYKFGELRQSVMELLGTGQSSAPVLQTVPSQPVQQAKPVAPAVQQEIPVQPAKSSETSDKKKKLIPIIAAAVSLVAIIGIVLAVVLSGGSGESTDGSGTNADGGSTVISDDVSDDVGAGDDTSQSEPETPPAINTDALVQAGVDMEPSESEGCRVLANSYDESFFVGGVKYNTGILLDFGNSNNVVSFNVDGAYEKMSFRAAVVDGGDHSGKFTVRVYLDDQEAQPIMITKYDLNKLYEYDITGVKTIKMKCDHRTFTPEVALTDFYFSSTKDSGVPSSFTSPFDESLEMLSIPADLAPYHSDSCRWLADSYDESFVVGGVRYNTGVLLDMGDAENTVAFNANGAFKKMSFRVGRYDGGGEDGEVTVRVYLDGKEAQPVTLTKYNITTLCEYDITDVRQIRLECDQHTFGPEITFTDFYICKSADAEVPSSFTSPFDESAEMLEIPLDYLPYDSDSCRWLADSYDESFVVGSVRYNTGVLLDQGDSENTVAFNANGKFAKMSFRVGRYDGGGKDGEVTVRVYLDGKEAQPVTLTKYNITKLCEYDITDVKQIRIECDTHTFSPEIALTDFYLCKSKDAVVPTSFVSPFEEAADMLNLPADLAPYDTDNCRWLANSYDDSFTIAGVEYNTGVVLCASDSENTAALNVNGVYKKLSFSAGQCDSDNEGDIKVRIYLDGNEQQPVILSPDSLKQYEYDITYAKQIRLECDSYWGAPDVGLTNIVLSK